MPTTKQELEIYHDDYIQSVKKNLSVIGKCLSQYGQQRFFNEAAIELMAEHGLTLKVIASLHGKLCTDISGDPVLMAAYEKGRSNIAARIRASLLNDALNKDLPYAKLHLDKVLNKEDTAQNVNLNITQTPLENVSTEELLNLDDGTDPSN